jgi:ribonuclease Z
LSFNLTILGSNSAVPAHKRYPTAQLLQHKQNRFLIDCGEGTQFQMIKYHIKRAKLDNIFISHLHGDHYLGLVGLISTLMLNGRTEDLPIYAPAYLEKILAVNLQSNRDKVWTFKIVFHALTFNKSYQIFENDDLEVFTIPLDHKIECNGFLFKEKLADRKIIPEKIKEFEIPYVEINEIKKGADFVTKDGKTIKNELLTLASGKPKSYAYCSDTKYNESIIPIIEGADLLYHESTFMHDLEEIAGERYHSTSIQAATIAEKAKVKQLAIGHFSARYRDLNDMLLEAQTVFKNTALAIEGTVFEI